MFETILDLVTMPTGAEIIIGPAIPSISNLASAHRVDHDTFLKWAVSSGQLGTARLDVDDSPILNAPMAVVSFLRRDFILKNSVTKHL